MSVSRKKTIATAAMLLSAALWMPAARAGGSSPDDFPLRMEGPFAVLELPWGTGSGELGRVDGDEAASLGPMSFTVTESGEIYILDQVNFRVVGFGPDGTVLAEWPIPADTFQDIALFGEDVILLLDRLVGRTILLVHRRTGRILNEHSIVGPSIPHTGLVTAMFARNDGVWLEYSHAYSVRVLDENLKPCRRVIVPGRPYRGYESSLGAAVDRVGGAQIWITDLGTRTPVDGRAIFLDHDIDRIIWLESDRSNNVYVMFHLLEYDEHDLAGVRFEGDVGLLYDALLNPVAVFESPHVITEYEQLREFKVSADGAVYQMAFAFDGVRIFKWKGVRP